MLERVWKERNLPTLLVGLQTGAATMEKSMEIPSKLKIELPYDPAIPLLGVYLEKTLKIHAPQCSQQHYLQ